MFPILQVDPCPLRYRFTLRDEKDVKLHIQGLFLSSEGPRKWSAALILCALENTDQRLRRSKLCFRERSSVPAIDEFNKWSRDAFFATDFGYPNITAAVFI
jgi:hypothetical protein